MPVDYEHPAGTTLDLAVIRHVAQTPDQRIGSLVVNFGGPGDPGTETLPEFLSSFPAEIRDRFDIVSFDPRGTGSSRPVDCVDDATTDKLVAQDPTPDTDAELHDYYRGDVDGIDLVAACVERNGSWLADVGTRNVARDMNQLRRALGDEKLTYVGFSYGTAIGAVFAEMFPADIRALVLDGAVNLSASPAQELAANAVGFESALDTFLADCSARTSCPLRRDGNPRTALERLRDRFEAGIRINGSYRYPDGPDRIGKVGVGEFYLAVLAALYQRSSWPDLAEALADASRGDGHVLLALADLYTGRGADGHFDNREEAISIINCDDRPDPLVSESDFDANFRTFSVKYPFWGRWLASTPLGCDPRLPRPAPGEALGDVRAPDAPPVLVVGTTGDPATPYAGAQDMVTRLAGSVLLTATNTQHGAYARDNACINTAVDRYLVDLVLPAAGTVCR